MEDKKTIELTLKQGQYLVNAIDVMVKNRGLASLLEEEGVEIFKIIKEAFEE